MSKGGDNMPTLREPALEIYKNNKFGFEFSYDRNVFALPSDVAKVGGYPVSGGAKFAHVVGSNVENVAVTFGVLEKPYEGVVAFMKKAAANLLTDIGIGNVNGVYYKVGEGEGQFVYLFPLGSNTLVVSRTFIDEEVKSEFKTVKDFISYQDQGKVFTAMIKSLKIFEVTPGISNFGEVYTYIGTEVAGDLGVDRDAAGKSMSFSVKVGTEKGCVGSAEGKATLDEVKKTFVWNGANSCVIEFTSSSNGIQVKETTCSKYHGPQCKFDGLYKKAN